MSDWNRGGREDDQRRYRDDERRDWGARARGSDDDQRHREDRSFDDRNRADWREPPRDRDQGSQRYGQGYGQPYGAQGHRAEGYRGSRQDHAARGYGAQHDPAQDSAGRGYGRRDDGQDRPRWDRERSDFLGRNEVLRRQEDGGADDQLWSSLGRGEHRGRGPKNYTRSDERIREDVNDQLCDDSWLDASEVEVQVAACEVTLTGTVTNREDRRRAEDVAEKVSGVKHVQNNLRVDPQPSGFSATTRSSQSSANPSANQVRGSGSQLS